MTNAFRFAFFPVAMVLSACAPITGTMAVPGTKEQAAQIVEQWTRAFTGSDVDGIVKLYAPDALFFGTGSKSLISRPIEIRNYFEAALLTNRPRTATVDKQFVLVLSDTAVVITGLDTITGVKDGKSTSSNGRVTFVIEKRDAGWKIVHFHRSAMPS